MFGMIEASITRRPSIPRTLAHPARTDRVKHRRYDTLHPFADLGVRLDARAGLDLFRDHRRQRLLRHDLADRAHRFHRGPQVFFLTHEVRVDEGHRRRVAVGQPHPAAALGLKHYELEGDARAVARRADSIGRDDGHVIALDRGFSGEVGRIPVGNRLDAVARRRAILGDEIAQARLHGAETLRGRLIAEIALYIGTRS